MTTWSQPFAITLNPNERYGLTAVPAGAPLLTIVVAIVFLRWVGTYGRKLVSLALDAADTIQAQDSLEKMLVHQMAVLHYGMMRATARMNKELDAAGGTAIDAAGRDLTAGEREAANVRACRLAGAISRMSAVYQQGLLTLQRKRKGRNRQITGKHSHQQRNVTQGGQAVVAVDKVMSRTRGRRRSDGGGTIANER